jgi:alkaline phosphatase D
LTALLVSGGTLAAQPGFRVLWVWSGAVTPRTAVVKAKVRGRATDLHLLVDSDPQMRSARRLAVGPSATIDDTGVATFPLTDLLPDTRYHYVVGHDDQRTLQGEFRTFADGPMSFAFAASACAGGNMFRHVSNHEIFATIERLRPLFFLHMGDFHYLNIGRNELTLFREAYDLVLDQDRQASLYRSTPLVYIWDDHDYGPNDSDRMSPARDAARAAYTQNVPHYPLVLENDRVGTIQQEFTVGRVRFIVSDLRSARDPIAQPDGPEKSLLGLPQRAWLVEAFTRAARDDVPLLVWVTGVPWITRTGARTDGWEPFAWERRFLADHLASLDLTQRMLVLSADAHMLAIDDGTHSNYATNAKPGERGFPVFHAGPLDRRPSLKGGPYSHGISTVTHQFGWIEVADDGTELRATLSGRDRAGRQVGQLRLQLTCRHSACAVGSAR